MEERVAIRAFWELSQAGLGLRGQTAHMLSFSHPAVTSPALWGPSFSCLVTTIASSRGI